MMTVNSYSKLNPKIFHIIFWAKYNADLKMVTHEPKGLTSIPEFYVFMVKNMTKSLTSYHKSVENRT